MSGQGVKLDAQALARIHELAERGMRVAAIAARLGITRQTVYRVLREAK